MHGARACAHGLHLGNTGQRITAVLDRAIDIRERMAARVDPARLSALVAEWSSAHPHR